MQVLEHQQQPGGSGQPPQQLQHGLAAHRRGVVAVPVALGDGDRREDRPQRRPPRRQPVVGGEREPAQRLQQGLGQRPVGTGGAGRNRPPGQDPDPAGPRIGGQLRGQPGLADPGLAGQEHHPARAVPGRGERGAQRAGLRLAADHHRAQQVRHQISMLRQPLPGTVSMAATSANTC